ncbi:MAG: hypothetical protein K0S76_626 [Herbinix sp.]|nr:hypothetical protein [Herbinix sp.]
MKKTYNIKFILSLVFLSFFIGSVPVYASSLFDSEILYYLEMYFNSHISGFTSKIDREKNQNIQTHKEEMKDYIDSSTAQAISNVDGFVQNEITRMDRELRNYMDSLYQQLPDALAEDEELLKEYLTNYVNQQIDSAKDELFTALSIEIQNHMIEELEGNTQN